jgi:hypothetical protein
MTLGFPNSILIKNDVEPKMLLEYPDDVSAEILSSF